MMRTATFLDQPQQAICRKPVDVTATTQMQEDIQIKEILPAEVPLALLLEADPSLDKINRYLHQSKCFAAIMKDEIVGICLLTPLSASDTYELMNIAVSPDRQQKGIGKNLLKFAVDTVRSWRARRLEVGTGTFGYQLAFYQKEGFRAFAVEKDFFLINYQNPIYENGLQHKDMLRLAVDF